MRRLSLAVLLSTCALLAQTNRGSIAGTVSDPSGGVIAGAGVKITNLGTAETRTLKTAENGTFAAPNLEPVHYRVEVESPGFKKFRVEDVKVDTGLTASVPVTLEPGSVETSVTVEAVAATVNTETGTAANTITQRQLQDVPLANRSVLDLAVTLPNVSGEVGTESPGLTAGTACPGCNLSIGGGRPLSSTIMADGTNNTGVSLGRSMVTFSPETVQEVTVQTSVFSAEYGNTGGGIISITTKSGTNQLHGAALWYVRNPAFAAAPWQTAATNRAVPTLKYNQFSLSAGGPVYLPKVYDGRNKTFWFAAVEPYYRRDHLDQYSDMPTDAMWNGDFSDVVQASNGYWVPKSVASQYGLSTIDSVLYNEFNLVNGNQFTQQTLATGSNYVPFPGNMIPKSMLDTVAQKIKPMVASGGSYFLDNNGNASNLLAPRLLSQDQVNYTFRVDQIFSDADRIYGRYTTTPIVKRQGTPVQETNYAATYSWARQAMLAETHTFSPTLFNDLRLNYTRGRFSDTVDPQYDVTTGKNLNTELGLPSITKGGLPSFNSLFYSRSFGNGSSTATGFGGAGSTQVDDKEERYAITDIVYKNVGSMALKFGVDASHQLQNVLPLYGTFGGIYAFTNYTTDSTGTSSGTGGSAFASFLLGVPGTSTAVTLRNVSIPYYYRWNAVAAFIQNDWKVKPNLTLNIGLRYSLQSPRTEKYNDQGVFRPDMAQSAQLSTPLTLADGSVLTSYQQIPFAYSGLGGNPRGLAPTQYRDFEPRFGFAWSPAVLQRHHVTLRGGWGMAHAPLTGFARLPNPDFGATTSATVMPVYASDGTLTTSSATAQPGYVLRLGENPPVLTATSVAKQIFLGSQPANGLTYANSLYLQQNVGAYAISQNYHTPYVNNWNLTIAWAAFRNTTVELGYEGSMGIHLFIPGVDINPKNSSVLSAELANNINSTATITDPAGRVNPITGKALTIQNGTLGSPYLGFSSLYMYYDAAGNSIRHAGFLNVVHQASRGLTFVANYTYGKSIDTASDAGTDRNVLTTGSTSGQIGLGGTRAGDRSVSLFDQRHVIHGLVLYDLPVGRGRALLTDAWKPLDVAVGGWTVSGILRANSGYPFMAYFSDSNQLGDATYAARPDIVNGVPLQNPLWDRNCPVGTGCQPYLNPSAFLRTALGTLGDAPRTLDAVRGPWDQYLDLSLQKNFRLGRETRVLQFRMDALNVLNHPTFGPSPLQKVSGYQFMGAPSTATLTTSAYNTWASANGLPAYSTTAGAAIYNGIVSMVNAQKVNGVLPSNFYNVQLPANFYGNAATSYDVRTLEGYKYYQLRTAYNTGFGTMYQNGTSRYIQFGVKLFF
jgi:hypothetical protein